MTQTCRAAKCIEAIRVTRLDQCTMEPLRDFGVGYAMGCVIDPEWSPEVEEGEESVVKDDCGNVCWRDDRCDQIKRWNLAFKIANPDPEFEALVGGNPLIDDGDLVTPSNIGVRELSHSCTPYLFVELFERTDECDGNGDAIYLRHVFPAMRLQRVGNEREGVFRLPSFEGKSRSVATALIGTGPYEDIPAAVTTGVGDETTDYVWFEDTDLPAVQCGAIDTCTEVDITSVTSTAAGHIEIHGTGLADVTDVTLTITTLGTINSNVFLSQTDTLIVIDYPPASGLELTGATAASDCDSDAITGLSVTID